MSESIEQQIIREVSAWPGVTIAPHRFGGTEFRVRMNYEKPWVAGQAERPEPGA